MSDDDVIEDMPIEDDTCALCLGRGVIIDDDGDEMECDECDGTGVLG